MTLRRILFWFHLSGGIVAGIVIFTMSVTGVCLAFERQILSWADHTQQLSQNIGAHSSADPRLPINALAANAQQALGASPSNVIVHADASAPVEFGLGRDRTVFVNPYNGAVLGEGSRTARAFFSQVENVHRWLGLQAEKRNTGRAITGACNLVFFLLVLSGPFLWWPKSWNWSNLRKIVLFRRNVSRRAMFWNWHHVIGFWLVIPLFFIVASGVVMSYPWANNLLYRMTGNEPPPPQQISRGQRPGRNQQTGNNLESGRHSHHDAAKENNLPQNSPNLDNLFARAEQQVSGWKSITLRIPDSPRAPFSFSIDQGNGGRPDLRGQLTLDRQTGDLVKWEPYSSYNMGRRLRIWARFTHTGEAGGWIGQSIAFLAALGASLLAFSGLSLSWIRFRKWRTRENSRKNMPEEIAA